jgi:hypothetical protein
MTTIAIIAGIAVAGIANAAVTRYASHPGVEPWPTD